MLTSTVLGLVTMVLFRPRSWCVYCPDGNDDTGICGLKTERIKLIMEEKGETNCGAAENTGE